MVATSMNKTTKPISPNTAVFRTAVSMLALFILSGVLVLGGAGRVDWVLGWVFLGVWLVPKIVLLVALWLHDPALLVERTTRHRNTPRYDRVILPIYFVFALITFLVASFDAGRFGWSGELPIWLIAAAYVVYLLCNGLVGWAIFANPYHSAESRLQVDRGQAVVSSGPYRIVRHPTYLASVLLWPLTGLMLGSGWAVIPGVVTALMMVIRTRYEDRMLRAELPGYADYAQQVRYRLLPGIW